MTYQTIVADPPWDYEGFATMPGRPNTARATKRVALPYSSMSVEDLALLPVYRWAASDCRLFLWTTNRHLPQVFSLIGVWGFTYRQTLVWHKTGNPSPFGGSVAPNHAEFLIVATRGTPTLRERLPGSVIAAPKPYQHSRKPDCFIDHVERCSPGPYLELFARRDRLGWDTWGNESLETAVAA